MHFESILLVIALVAVILIGIILLCILIGGTSIQRIVNLLPLILLITLSIFCTLLSILCDLFTTRLGGLPAFLLLRMLGLQYRQQGIVNLSLVLLVIHRGLLHRRFLTTLLAVTVLLRLLYRFLLLVAVPPAVGALDRP